MLRPLIGFSVPILLSISAVQTLELREMQIPRLRASRSARNDASTLPDSAFMASYRWRNIGPDRGGRSIAVSGVKGKPREAYFGATGGGLWKTTDAGENWGPITDGQLKSASVGAVAVSESNTDIIYIGMGESCIRGNIMPGDGVYKSTNAGRTWTHIGFSNSDAISKIRVHPTNPDIVFVASFGRYGAPSTERGVYKSADGGKTWKQVLYRDDKTGAVDISIDRNNPNVMYAAMWEAFRKEYTMSSGGPGSGLYKSTDGGEHWTEITRNSGLPSGVDGRIGVSVSGANSNRVYALIENEKGGLFKSDDAGATWTMMNESRDIRQRAFYYTHVYADPKNQDVVYVQNTNLFRSRDAGKTLQNAGNGTHGDHHDLWIDPDNTDHLVVGDDGGGMVSTNGGARWTARDFPTGQFYHVALTKHLDYHVCGTQQDDQTTICIEGNWNLGAFNAAQGGAGGGGGRGGRAGGGGRGAGGDSSAAPPLGANDITLGGMRFTQVVAGGEPGYVAPDPLDPDIYYGGRNNGQYVEKYNARLDTHREVNPYPWFYSGEASKDIKERWQWTFPIIFSMVDPHALYVSSQRLWKTTNGGRTWSVLSGDLTRHDPSTMGASGGPITGDMNGPEVYAVIFSVGPSKKNVNTIWTGSDDGLVHVTRDNGKSWSNVTPKDMPEFGRVSQIDASAFNDGGAYISVRRPLLNDQSPYIWKTSDYGRTWTKIVNGIRADDYIHAVREDPTRRGLLYAAGQHGMYISYDDGAKWESLRLNMPDAPVSDIMVGENDLVISTHGRGFWVLDNIGPLREANPALLASESYLFKAPVGVRGRNSVTLTWMTKTAPKIAKLDILDSAGSVLRTFEPDTTRPDTTAGRGGAAAAGRGGRGGGGPFLPKTAGVNRITWDMRTAPIASFPGMILWGAGTNGPTVPPGKYTARLTIDGKALTTPVMVKRNPLLTDVSDADLRAQYAFAKRIRDKANEANESVIGIRRVKSQLTDREKKSDDATLKRLGDTLTAKVSDVEDDIYQVKNQSGQDPLNFPIKVNNRLANLLSMTERGDGPPNNNWTSIYDILVTELKGYTTTLDRIYKSDLVAVNKELLRLKLAPLDPNCPKVEGCVPTP